VKTSIEISRPGFRSQIKSIDMASTASRNATKPLPQRKKITTKGRGKKKRSKKEF
jgi:hypothetical protein